MNELQLKNLKKRIIQKFKKNSSKWSFLKLVAEIQEADENSILGLQNKLFSYLLTDKDEEALVEHFKDDFAEIGSFIFDAITGDEEVKKS